MSSQRPNMLDTLRRIVQDVAAAPDVDVALEVVVREVQQAMGTAVCSVYLLDRSTNRYVFSATEGLNADQIGRVALAQGEGLVTLVAERAEPVNLQQAVKHPRFHAVPAIGEEAYQAFLGVPVIHHREVLGVLVVQEAEERTFDEEDESFLITLSAQLAGVIAHARATGALRAPGTSNEISHDARFRGRPGAPGVGIGTAVVMSPQADLDSVQDRQSSDVMVELLVFDRAIKKVREDIREVSRRLSGSLPPEEIALFDAYLNMLDDGALGGEVAARIREGQWAQGALRRVITDHARAFEQMENSYLRERAADVRELGQRVLAYLQDVHSQREHFPERIVLVGAEISAAMLGEVPSERVVGMVSTQGSGSSHAAIVARALGIPAVMGCEDLPITDVDGMQIVCDGFYGDAYVRPSHRMLEYYRGLIEDEQQLVEELKEDVAEPAETPDGHRVQLLANINLEAEIPLAIEYGAEGLGLYRTEVPFISSDRFPTEEEQQVRYRNHIEAFAPRPVTMRTLDIGGDKALSYFPIREDNPFLGWRGIRVTLDHPEILVAQVRAMIRASAASPTRFRIMLPMISSVAEIDEALGWIRRCYHELVEEGNNVQMPEVGVMIEVPAAVFQIRDIVERSDFVSVGSNDLTQYLLAVDRNNLRVASLYQEQHPAVLCALHQVVEATHAQNKPVGICGELAGTPAGAVLLMGMGFDTLSMNATNLLRIKRVIRETPLAHAQRLVKQAMTMESAEAVGQFMRQALVAGGLGRLIGPERI